MPLLTVVVIKPLPCQVGTENEGLFDEQRVRELGVGELQDDMSPVVLVICVVIVFNLCVTICTCFYFFFFF